MWAVEILAIFALVVLALGFLYLIGTLTIFVWDAICDIKDRIVDFKTTKKEREKE